MKLARLGVLVASFVTTSPVLAQAVPSEDAWQFEATPYLWAAGLSGWGRLGARTPTTNIDASFSDVWKNLDFGVMGAFEARRGRWALIFDSVYVDLSKTSDPLAGGALGTVRFKVKEAIFQLAGAYRVLDNPVTPVDVLVGARYTNLHVDASFSQSPLLPAEGV
ncbi:hypothetical protein [Paraburkholderia sp. RAU2J]|uniref:hypothetical protein n=1 Tax=Paraburkholderia sp. RAU2J TaxID=1938810 RepID=UPI0011C46073|nr:hypothetical protein [Paraburkholderia sp. RAU2J]